MCTELCSLDCKTRDGTAADSFDKYCQLFCDAVELREPDCLEEWQDAATCLRDLDECVDPGWPVFNHDIQSPECGTLIYAWFACDSA